MSRKPSSPHPTLPTPAPKNIANREYYHTSETTDAHDADVEYPNPSPDKQQTAESSNVNSTDVYDFIEVRKTMPPSPSPSDIVLSADLRDTAALSLLERETRELPRARRKEMLVALRERLVREREVRTEEEDEEEEREKRAEEERGAEYKQAQLRGRDDV